MTGVIINNKFYDISTGSTKIEYNSMGNGTLSYSMYGENIPEVSDTDKILQWLCPKTSLRKNNIEPSCELDHTFSSNWYYEVEFMPLEKKTCSFVMCKYNSKGTWNYQPLPTTDLMFYSNPNNPDSCLDFRNFISDGAGGNMWGESSYNTVKNPPFNLNQINHICAYRGKQSFSIDVEPNIASSYTYRTDKTTNVLNTLFADSDKRTSSYDENNYRFYYLKVYETYKDNLLYHYVPCISNNVLGVKELVNNKFYPLLGDLVNVTYQE